MPAYSFQPRFVEPIRAGTKGGTIRAPRKLSWTANHKRSETGGHAWPGETLMLYCRQRQPSGFKITDRTCLAVEPIFLDFAGDGRIVIGPRLQGTARTVHAAIALHAFANFDGFESWPELADFWLETHRADHFHGWHIRWLPLPPWFT